MLYAMAPKAGCAFVDILPAVNWTVCAGHDGTQAESEYRIM